MMKTNDPLAHLRWLAHHPSLLVSGTAHGAIKALEDQERSLTDANEELRQVAHAVAQRGCNPLTPLGEQVGTLVRVLDYTEAKTGDLLDLIIGSPDHPQMLLTIDDGVSAVKAMKTWMSETWARYEAMMHATEYLALISPPGHPFPSDVAAAIDEARSWCDSERETSV